VEDLNNDIQRRSNAMYLIRRVYKVKPGQTKKAAELIYKIGNRYTEAGQRDQVRVYWSGYTVPGPPNTVYMEWTSEKIESPYRKDNPSLGPSDFGKQLSEIQEESYIEFFEMFTPEKSS